LVLGEKEPRFDRPTTQHPPESDSTSLLVMFLQILVTCK